MSAAIAQARSSSTATDPRTSIRGWAAWGLIAGLALHLALVALFWVGFIGSDDVTFARGAYGWLEHFPYVGGHGTIRYPLTMPLALSFAALGGNEVALALPSLLYALGALTMLWLLVRRAAGPVAALVAMLFAASMPLFVTQGSIANVDMPELFFQAAGLWAFSRGLDADAARRRRWFLVAGAASGLGFLTRETAVFVALFYAVLFLAAYRAPRAAYLWIAAGFVGVWAIEVAYLFAMTGDPLYRVTIALNHDATIDRSVDLAGNLLVHPAVDPLLVLLVNQEFMALFWLAIPAGVWLLARPEPSPAARHGVLVVALFGAATFIAAAAATTLLPLNPRYFSAAAWAGAGLIGIAIARLLRGARGRRMAAGALLVLAAGNAIGLIVENRDPMAAVRVYADAVAASDAVVTTDPVTRYRATLLLRWNGAAARARAAPPVPGGLHFWNGAATAAPSARLPAADLAAYRRPAGIALPLPSRARGFGERLVAWLARSGPMAPLARPLADRFARRAPVVALIRVARPCPEPAGPAAAAIPGPPPC